MGRRRAEVRRDGRGVVKAKSSAQEKRADPKHITLTQVQSKNSTKTRA